MHAELHPFAMNTLRWLVAFGIILPLFIGVTAREGRAIVRNIRHLALASILGVVAFNSLIYTALTTIKASTAALLFATSPILIIFMNCIQERRTLKVRHIIGAMASLVGVWIILSSSSGPSIRQFDLPTVLGASLVVAASFTWARYTICLQSISRDISSGASFLSQITIGLLVLLPTYFMYCDIDDIEELSVVDWICIGYLGTFAAAFAFLLWQVGVRSVGSSRSGVFVNIIPLSSVTLSWAFLGESIHAHYFLGGFLVIVGVLIAQGSSARLAAAARSPMKASVQSP